MENEENKNPEVLDAEEAKQEFNGGRDPKPKRDNVGAFLLNSLLSSLSLFILIAYIVCGACIKDVKFGVNELNAWQTLWPMLILMPVPEALIMMLAKRKLSLFPTLLIITSLYCFIGMFLGLWHPYWALFFIVPVFSIFAAIIDRQSSK